MNQASNSIVAKDYRKYLQNLKWGLASPPILHGPQKTEGRYRGWRMILLRGIEVVLIYIIITTNFYVKDPHKRGKI